MVKDVRPFHFRLETLLKYRRLLEGQAQIKLAQATAEYMAEHDRLAALRSELQNQEARFREESQKPLTIAAFKIFQQYHDKLDRDISQQLVKVQTADTKRRECIAALEEAVKARKLVEKLREKRLAQYHAENLQEEQKVLDELGLQAFVRNS